VQVRAARNFLNKGEAFTSTPARKNVSRRGSWNARGGRTRPVSGERSPKEGERIKAAGGTGKLVWKKSGESSVSPPFRVGVNGAYRPELLNF